MRMMPYLLLTALSVFVLTNPSASGAAPGKVGETFPTFSGKDVMTGEAIDLAGLRGKVVLVDFWATWCPPCRAAVPELRELQEKFGGKGLEIVSISLDRVEAPLKKYVQDNKMTWKHIFDKGGKLANQYSVRQIPTVFVVGRDGKLIASNPHGASLRKAIRTGLKQTYVAAPSPADTGEVVSPVAPPAAEPTVEPVADPAPLTEADEARAKRWLAIAEGMRQNGNTRLARKYADKLVNDYPQTREARLAGVILKALPE